MRNKYIWKCPQCGKIFFKKSFRLKAYSMKTKKSKIIPMNCHSCSELNRLKLQEYLDSKSKL